MRPVEYVLLNLDCSGIEQQSIFEMPTLQPPPLLNCTWTFDKKKLSKRRIKYVKTTYFFRPLKLLIYIEKVQNRAIYDQTSNTV